MNLRVINLKHLIELEKSQTAFAEKIGLDKAQLNRYLNKPDQYPISDNVALRIEGLTSKPEGWLSQKHEHSSMIKTELCVEAVMAACDILESYDITLESLNKTAQYEIVNAVVCCVAQDKVINLKRIKSEIVRASLKAQFKC